MGTDPNTAALGVCASACLPAYSLYGGLILGTLAYSLWSLSLSHFEIAVALFLMPNAKTAKEEVWLEQRYPDYGDYRQRVKKLIPWVY